MAGVGSLQIEERYALVTRLDWIQVPLNDRACAVSFWSVLLLSIGLAMDATVVAAARGLAARRTSLRDAVTIGAYFGGFQALMPWLGWLLGQRLGPLVQAWQHWIAFALLAGLGTKMSWDALNPRAARSASDRDAGGRFVLLLLALATSIDAFAVGVTLPMIGASLGSAIATIGITTAVLSVLGFYAGRHFGDRLGRRLELVGGLLLIGLGVKIVVEQLVRAR